MGDFKFSEHQVVYSGKVRDVYKIDDHIVMVVSDRISAFDHILPKTIPYKGQVLNQIAAHFLTATKNIVPNWFKAMPHPNVSVGILCDPIPVEMVIRGYLAGHAAREYKRGIRIICGVLLPEGLSEGDKLPEPIITPTTKASEGHDQDISREDIIANGIVSESDYLIMEKYTRELYKIGSEMAQKQGLILVDTKYEFGKKNGEVLLMDEVHTPDSSRYYISEGYTERQANKTPQLQLSKEFVREWLIANGFQGHEGQIVPEMKEDIVRDISQRYIDLFQKITGREFIPSDEAINESAIRDLINAH